jgi:hypothetical protein
MPNTQIGMVYKMRRARLHFRAIERSIRRFNASDANSVVNDFHTEPGYLVVRALSRRQPSQYLSQLIGDWLYNIRATLDYAACELARLNEQPIDDQVEFPIFLERDDFWNPHNGRLSRGASRRIGKLHPIHQAIVESQQPFHGRHGTPEDDPLWLLYRLSNFDRHQFVHLTSVVTNASAQEFTPPEVRARFELVSVSHGTFSRQAEVARWRILPGPDVDVHVESSVRFDIGFDDGGPGAGRPVLTTLGDIGMRVMHIIDGFANAVLPE